jgi:integrase
MAMSVKIRPYRTGGWEVDITVRLPNGSRLRERSKAPVSSKSAAQRWGEDRERHLLQHGPPQPPKEVPTLETFAPRFVDGYARANRQKPSGIVAKESILTAHLIPQLGSKRLDAIASEHVQALKRHLVHRKPKTLNMLLKKAVEWDVIERMPCAVRLLPVSKPSMGFYDFDEYERLVDAAKALDGNAYFIVLLGGEAGLRCGEIIALEWSDVDLGKRQLCVQRSEWRGHVTAPKSGRLRHVPMTVRLAAALREHRHLRAPRVVCQRDGSALTQDMVSDHVARAAKRAGLGTSGVHRLRHSFCSHLAMRGAPARAIQELAGHQDLITTQRYMHLSPAAIEGAIRLLDRQGPAEAGHYVRSESGRSAFGRGDILETADA